MWTQYSQPQPCEASASDVMALMERAYRKVYPKPPKPTSEEKVKLEADVTALKIVAKFAAQQRCAPRRSIYKRPTGSNPTVMDWSTRSGLSNQRGLRWQNRFVG